MPKKPARPEKNPPVRNAKGTQGFCNWKPYAMMAKMTASTTNTIVTTLYCCLRYAIAPLRTCSAISFMRSVPSSAFFIWRKKYSAMPSDTTDATGTSQNTLGMLNMLFCCYVS